MARQRNGTRLRFGSSSLATLTVLVIACNGSLGSEPNPGHTLAALCGKQADIGETQVAPCRLWSRCEGGHGHEAYCQPATLLAAACIDLEDALECRGLKAPPHCPGSSSCAPEVLAHGTARRLEEDSHDSHDSHTGGSKSTTATEPCIADPSKADCASYQYPEANATANVDLMCDQMPNMVGCTLRNSCKERSASSGYCAPFSLLADMCVDMPSMSGCRAYVALCKTSGTVVKQCDTEPAVAKVLTTDDTTRAVLRMCGSHSMIGCDTCTDPYTNCPDPLKTMSTLCWGMSGMADCDPFYSMCDSAAGNDFPDLCNKEGGGGEGGGGGGSVPPMTMWFHQRVSEVILFRQWVPRSTIAYVGSWVLIFVMAVLVQGLKALRTMVEYHWIVKQRETLLCHCGEPEPDLPKRSGLARFMTGGQLYRNTVRTLFTGLMVLLEYWLMLIVMIFNIGFFVAVVTGYMLGALLFGHVGEAAQNYVLPPGAKDGAASGPSITAPVELPPPDLTKNGCCSSDCV